MDAIDDNDSFQISPAQAWMTLFSGMLLYVAVNFLRSALPGPVFDQLQAATGGTAGQVAGLGAAYMYSYAAIQLFTGLWVDHFGGIRVIRIGGAAMALSALLLPFCYSIPMLYICRAACGLGSGMIYLGLVKETTCFPKRLFGFAISLLLTTGFLGGVLATGPFTSTVIHFGLHRTLLGVGVGSCIIYALWFIGTMRMPQPKCTAWTMSVRPFREALRNRQNINVIIFSGLNYAPFCVLQTVLGMKFCQDYCGMSPVHASLVFTVASAIVAAAAIGVTSICRLTGNRHALCCKCVAGFNALLFTLLSASILSNIRTSALSWVIYLLAAASLMTPITTAILRLNNPEERFGTVTSMMNFMNYVFVAVLGSLSGTLMEIHPPQIIDDIQVYGRLSYQAAFLPLTLGTIWGFYFALNIKKTTAK